MLGRDFLQAMKGFIDIGKGQIRLQGKAKGTYLFPRKNKYELIENPFEILGDPSDFGEFRFDLFALCLAQRRKRKCLLGGNPIRFSFCS